ncbi:MAG: CBS domain-containing protein [Elusimicrobiota bacterium]|nr:MAG: CBS domain-containing protein [Elusimicrobiota bacterium]
MKIKELMTKDVECLDPGASLKQAAQLMSDADVGGLPIVDPSGRVVGVLTDRDIVVRTVAAGLNPADSVVADAMTPEVVHCHSEDDVEDAAELMAAHQIRRVVVTDDAGALAGIVALADLSRKASDEAADVLEEVSRPPESAAEIRAEAETALELEP